MTDPQPPQSTLPTKQTSPFYWQDLLVEMLNRSYLAYDMIAIPYEIRKANPDLPTFMTSNEFKAWYPDLQEVAYRLDNGADRPTDPVAAGV